MSSAVRLTRRPVIALSLAFALALMHGGIGQAMVCGGMDAMTAMSMGPAALSSSTPAINAVAAGQHHQPVDQPEAMHTSMCVSTPAAVGAGGSKAGPAVIGLIDHRLQSVDRALLPGVRPTGHGPPTPDLVSELCVIRI
jgi:hypothetical protein